MGDIEWTNDLVIRLIQEYAKRPELWDAHNEMYRVQSKKYETWRELADMFECNIADLRKKLNSLFASHRREKAKIRAGGRSTWFLYPHMSFLPTHIDERERFEESVEFPISETVTIESRPRPPVKEAEPPSNTSSDLDLEEQLDSEILVKEEPTQFTRQVITARPYKKQVIHRKPRLTIPIKRRRTDHKEIRSFRKSSESYDHSSSDDKLAEALRLLRRADLSRKKDECDSFGEYIADSLRKHDERTQSMIKQAINNILFEQEMKKYNSNQYTVVISGIDENPLILGDDGSEEVEK